jgi:Arc/MetJ-type ribon-helix-helix transcriptional regulator
MMPQGMMPHWVMPEMYGPPDMAYGMGGQPDTTQQYGMIGELGMIGPQPGMLPGMMPWMQYRMPWMQYRMPWMQYPHMMPATMPGMMVDVDALTAVEDRREARLEARLHVGQVHDASGDSDSDESDEVDAGLVTEAILLEALPPYRLLEEVFRTPAWIRYQRVVGQLHDTRRQSGDSDSDESDEVDAGLVTEAIQEIFRTPARRRRRRCRSRSVAAQRRAAAINNL